MFTCKDVITNLYWICFALLNAKQTDGASMALVGADNDRLLKWAPRNFTENGSFHVVESLFKMEI